MEVEHGAVMAAPGEACRAERGDAGIGGDTKGQTWSRQSNWRAGRRLVVGMIRSFNVGTKTIAIEAGTDKETVDRLLEGRGKQIHDETLRKLDEAQGRMSRARRASSVARARPASMEPPAPEAPVDPWGPASIIPDPPITPAGSAGFIRRISSAFSRFFK